MTRHLQRSISEELDSLAPLFDELTLWSARFGILMLDNLEIRPVARGLDVGCGTGFPLLELASLHGPRSHFTGIDTWSSALDIARRKVALHRVSNVVLEDADASALPFEDHSFDLITSNLGINNFDDPGAAVGEAFRVARPGGRLAITSNPIGTMPEVYDQLREELRAAAPDAVAALDAQERHRGTVESCQDLLTSAGFELRTTVEGSFTMTFRDGAALFRHVLTACFLEGWRGALPPESTISILEAAEKAFDARAAVGPIETTVAMVYLEARRPD